MKLVKVTITITVREAILLCIENEIEGSERQLASFDNSKPNRLRGDQVTALTKNLECIYHNVEVTGGGKRGKVFLSNKKKNATEREDGRVNNTGQPTAKEQITMNQYIYNQLKFMCKSEFYSEFSLSGWSKQLGFIDVDDIPDKSLEKRIREVHANTPFNRIKTSEVVKVFKTDTIYNRNIQVVKSALNRLSRDGEIELLHHFNMMKLEGNREKIDKYKYEQIKLARKELLESMGSSIGAYNYAFSNPSPSKKQKEIIDAVEHMFKNEYGCQFIYESFEVISVKDQDDYEVFEEDFEEAYWTRLIALTESRQRSYDNKPLDEQTWFWRKFYAYNTLVLMEYIGIDTNGLLLECEMGNKQRAVELNKAFQEWEQSEVEVNSMSDEEIEIELEGLF